MNKKLWQRIVVLILFVLAIYLIVTHFDGVKNIFSTLLSVFSPFIIGMGLAFVINLPTKFFENLFNKYLDGKYSGAYRGVSILLSILLIVLIIYFLLFLVYPDIEITISNFIQAIPNVIGRATRWVDSLIVNHPELVRFVQNLDLDTGEIESRLIGLGRDLATGFLSSVQTLVPTIIASVVDFFIALIFAISVVANKEMLVRQFRKFNHAFFSDKWANFFINVANVTNKTFSLYLAGQAFEALLTGTVLFVVMKIFSFPYALTISVLTGLTTFIPVYGAIFGGIVGFFLIASVDLSKALWFVVLIVVVQQVEGNILYPRVMGNQIGIPSLYILVVVTVGGALFGIPGMLLAVPIFSVLYRIISENVNYRMDEQDLVVNPSTNMVEHESTSK